LVAWSITVFEHYVLLGKQCILHYSPLFYSDSVVEKLSVQLLNVLTE